MTGNQALPKAGRTSAGLRPALAAGQEPRFFASGALHPPIDVPRKMPCKALSWHRFRKSKDAVMNFRLFSLIGLSGLLLLNHQSHAQYRVYPADARIEQAQPQKGSKPVPDQGGATLFYCLPQNSIHVKVILCKTTHTKGLYSNYAEQLLKLPAFPDCQESFRIEKIEMQTEAIPDPGQVFCVQGVRLPRMEMSPDGILLSVNRNEPDAAPGPRSPQPSGGTDPEAGSQDPGGHSRLRPRPLPHESIPGHGALPVADMNASRRFDTLVKEYRTDTALVIEKILQPVMDQKSLSEQARKMAEKIFKIQADQADLLSGMQEVAYPSGTMKFMYRKLEDTKRRLIEYFTGTFQTERIECEIRVQPQQGTYTYGIAYFSPENGLEILDQEEQVQAFENQDELLVLQLRPLPGIGGQAAGFENRNRQDSKDDAGFRYRIPAKVEASLMLDGKEAAHGDFFIPQWGQTFCLPSTNCRIALDPETGALRSYEELPASHPVPGKNKSKNGH